MKYLKQYKLFESNLYFNITEDEFKDLIHRIESPNQKDLDRLENYDVLNSNKIVTYIDDISLSDIDDNHKGIFKCISVSIIPLHNGLAGNYKNELEIFNINDEYYIIRCIKMIWRGSWRQHNEDEDNNYIDPHRYHMCDTFDGIIDIIENYAEYEGED